MAVYNLPNYTNDQGFGLPLNIRRGNPNPLDNSAVWASLDAAKNYAKTDPTAYVGQIISVVDNANSVVDVYKINDTAGNLVLVGTVTLGDDQSIVKNDDDTLSLYDFGKKYYKFVAANGDVAAHYEATEGWKDGLEPKVSGGVLAWYEPNPTTVDGLQSSINNLQAEVDTNELAIKANTDAIAVLNGDKTTEGSVAYQIAAVVAGANADFDTLKEIADWIAAHPDSVATINAAIKGNTDAIADLKELVGTDSVADQIAAAIEDLNIGDYAKAADLEDAIEDITANADAIEELQGLVGEGTVNERIDAAVKETVDGVKQDKFALRVHGHTVSDVDGLGAALDTKATNDTVNAIDLRVKAIEDGLDTAIDAAIQEHNEAADLKYETIENVSLLSGQIDIKVAALEKADTDNLAAAKAHAETKIAELNITQYAKQADLDEAEAAIEAIKDHATVDSFADVMDEVAKKQDIIPENTYDAYGAAAAVDTKLEQYKTAANKRLDDLEAVDNATQAEMDEAVEALEAADAEILAKIGTVDDGDTVVGLIGAAQSAADNARAAADAVQGDVDALETLVGAVPEGSDTVIAYVNKKAEEVLKAATGGSTESAASVKLALDNYIALNDPKVSKNTEDIATAQSKADEAFELAGTKATMAEVNEAIAGAGHAVATEVETAINGINAKIGEVAEDTNLVDMIAAAQEAATYDDEEVRGLIGDNADAIKAISDDYLKGSDKAELEGKIDAKADQTALDAEIQRATGIEGGLRTDVDAIKADYLKAADKEELQGNIDTLTGVVETLRDGIDAEKVDGVKDLIDYVEEHGAEVTGMKEDIAANAKAIEDEAKRAGEAEEALGGRIDELSGVVETKAAAADLTALGERVTAAEGKITTLEGEMDAVEGRATTLEGKVADLEAASATHATKDELQAVSDVADAAVTVEEMNAAISAAGHASQADLTAHIDDAVKHITADERAAWNAAEQNAKDHSDANLATAKAYADQAELDAIAASKTETESQVAAEAAIARAAEQANAKAISDEVTARENAVAGVQSAVDTNTAAITKINGDANTDGSFAKADAAVLAGAKTYSDEKLAEALTWGEF